MPEMLALRDTDPRQVGVYRLLGRLGEGGQGVVFLAEGPAGSPAAVKLLPPTTDPQVRSRFLKEVAAAQRVARFCTAQVLDAGIFERRPFIVSEYVSGPSLVEVVEQFGPRGGGALERVAVATLTALGAVHAAGMVHRDFKPGNVLLGPDGPVVIDFGLAAVPGMTTVLSGEVAIGTPAFMAPEQLAGTRVTAAADMWSWAVTMVFAGTGELPFKGDSLTATAYAILHAEPQVGGLPEPLGSLVYRCLNKDAAGRPSARDVLAELVAAGARPVGPMPPMVSALAVDEETSGSQCAPVMPPRPRHGSGEGLIAARPASGPRSARHGSRRIRWRRRAPVLLAAGLLAAAVGVLVFILPRHGPASEQLAGSHAPVNPASPLRTRPGNRPSTGSCSRSAGPQSCHATPRYAGTWSARASRPGTCRRSGRRRTIRSALIWWSPPGRSEPSTGTGWPPSTPRPSSPASAPGPPGSTSCWSIPAAPPAYDADRQTALPDRKTAGAQLLANSHIKASAAARAQLLSGDVDPRLPKLLAIMAENHPVHIVDFVGQSPGGGPASLLRSVDLAAVDSAAHMTRAAYLGWMQAFIDAQRAQYRPASVRQVPLNAGQTVLRIGFGAPSPLS